MCIKNFCILISFCYFPIFISAQNWYPVNFPNDNMLNGPVFTLHVFNSELYAGGNFWLEINGTKTYSILKWDGANWDSLSIGIDLNPQNGIWSGGDVRAIHNFNNKLYVGGLFEYAGHITAPTIAEWDGIKWNVVNTYFNGPPINTIQEFNGKLYVGGTFYTLQNDSSYVNVDCCIATWDGAIWDSVSAGSLDGVAKTMIYKNDLYVGGGIYKAGGTPVYNVARYDGSQWHPLEQGTAGQSGWVTALENDTVNDLLYVGGQFEYVIKNDSTNLPTSGLGIWNGTEWSVPSEKLPDNWYAVTLKMYHGLLYTGSGTTFFSAWNGKHWEYINGMTNTIACFGIYQDTLFAGGYFSNIIQNGDTLSAPGLVRWWSPNYCDSAHAIINFLSDTVSLQASDSVQVTSAGFSNQWEWIFGDGAPQDTAEKPIHIYDSAGIFTLKLRATYGLCPWAQDSVIIDVNPLGTSDFHLPSSVFKIYPNPTGDSFTVEIQNSKFIIQNSSFKIYDVKGKLVYQSEIKNPKSEISSKGWEKGIYFVNLVSEGKVISEEKVVVE